MRTDTKPTVAAVALLAIAAGSAGPAKASTPPNINGAVFETSGTNTRFNCTDPALDGAFPFNSVTEITRQSGADFSASETVSGVFFSGLYNGTIDGNGDVSGTSSATAEGRSASGRFSGFIDIAAGVLDIQNQGEVRFDSGETCEFVANIDGTLISGPVASGAIVDTARVTSIELITPTSLFTEVQAITGGLGARVRDVLGRVGATARLDGSRLYLGAPTGLAAGDLSALGSIGVWGSVSRSSYENDFAPLAYDGRRYSAVAGVDASPTDRLVVGASLGYETADVDTFFNRGNLDSDGYTVAPYAGYLINDTWSVDASFGWSSIESDQFRRDPVTGARITSSPDSDRYFGQFNLNGVTFIDRWTLGGRVGLLWAKSVQDRFVESDGTVVPRTSTKLGQFSIGGDVAYQVEARGHGIFEPFAGLSYQYDWQATEIRLAAGPQPSNDDDDVLLSAGVRYFGDGALSGSFSWSRRLGRDDFDEDLFNLTVRMQF